MRRLKLRRFWAVLCGVGLAFSITNAVFAKSAVWNEYNFDVTVQANGDLRVVETQVIDFQGGPFREGFAEIPLANTDGITEVNLSEPGHDYQAGSVRPFGFQTADDGKTLTVTWGLQSISDVTRTFTLSYTVHGAVRQYAAGDKIRFMLVSPASSDSDFTIYSSKIAVHTPDGGTFVNDPDSIGPPLNWQIGLDNRSATAQSSRSYNASEGLAIELVFKHGAITGPKPSWQAGSDAVDSYTQNVRPWVDLGLLAISIALLLAAPAALYLIWYLFGRDPAAAIAPDYLPDLPSDLPPGLAGVLIDEKADLRDVTATVIDLARRGYIQMEEQVVTNPVGAASSSYTLHKTTPATGALRPYEAQLYTALFQANETAKLQALPASFFSSLYKIEDAMYQEVVRLGLFRSHPEKARSQYRTAGVVVIVLTVVAMCLLFGPAIALADSGLCLFAPMALFGIGLLLLSERMPARTRAGANESAKWRAFQKYLGNLRQYRDVANVSDQFEKYLAYAVAFGLERRWVGAFAQAPSTVFIPAPLWYRPWPRPLAAGAGPLVAGAGPAASGVAPAGSLPNLNQMGAGLTGGLNSLGDSLVGALNAAGRSFGTPPASAYHYSGGGSRISTGGRSSFRGGGGFHGGGFSGGGSRGFR